MSVVHPMPAVAEAQRAGMRHVQGPHARALLDALGQRGPSTAGELAPLVGISERRVAQALRVLARRFHLVHRDGQKWRLLEGA